MKLHAAAPTHLYTITGYGADFVQINAERHTNHLIVTPETLYPWSVRNFDALTPDDFSVLLSLSVEVVILGTATRQRFAHPRLIQHLTQARIGVECMDLQAACRTYNILMSEERKVAAALLFE